MPTALTDYAANFKRFMRKDITFYVATDAETPEKARVFCADLQDKFGYPVMYIDPAAQESLSPLLHKYIPPSIQVRNFAILAAYHAGAEAIITIDDDNLINPKTDYLGHHFNKPSMMGMLRSETGWVNVCAPLKERCDKPFYHRGFPIDQRISHAS